MARNPERGGGIVSSVLISLAAAFGVAVIGLGGGIGAGMVMYGPLDAPADVVPQAQGQEVQEPAKGSYIGPSLMIENGEVVWRRDGSGQDQGTPEPAESPVNQPEDAALVQSDPVNDGTPAQPDAVPAPTPQPEKPAASAGQQPTNSATKPATKTPSSSAGTSSGSKVTAAPNQTQPSRAQPSAGTESTGNRDFSGGRVLATTASNNNNDPVYHTKNCRSAQKIATSDEKWYNSAGEAEGSGRRLCKICGK